MEGRVLVVYRDAVAYGEPARTVTRLTQPAPITCSNCGRERWFRPVRAGN